MVKVGKELATHDLRELHPLFQGVEVLSIIFELFYNLAVQLLQISECSHLETDSKLVLKVYLIPEEMLKLSVPAAEYQLEEEGRNEHRVCRERSDSGRHKFSK